MDVITGTVTDLSNPQNISPRTEPVASPSGDRLYFSAYRYQPPIQEYGIGYYHIPTGSFTMHLEDTAAPEIATPLTVHPNGKVYFGARQYRSSGQPTYPVANRYSYDGSSLPQKLTNFPASSPHEYSGVTHDIISAGPYMYMKVTDGVEGPDLFRHYPGTATAARVADILPGTGGSEPQSFRVLGNTLYFTAYTDTLACNAGFFVASATNTIHPLPTGTVSCAKGFRVAAYQGKLHYVTVTDTAGYEIHRVDFSPLGIESTAKSSTLIISPNPASSHLSISVSATGSFTATILSTTGQILHTESIAGGASSIPVADLPPGLYFLNVSDVSTRLPVGSVHFVKQ